MAGEHRLLGEDMSIAASETVHDLEAEAERRQERILELAAHLVRAISGGVEDVVRYTVGSDDTMTATPKGLPGFSWEGRLVRPGGEDLGPISSFGGIGSYAHEQAPADQRPADTLDAAFLAGVIAATSGLVDGTALRENLSLHTGQDEEAASIPGPLY
jgi:hypothetical protein